MPNDFDRLLATSLFRYRRSRAALRASKLLLNVSRIGIERGRVLLGPTGEPNRRPVCVSGPVPPCSRASDGVDPSRPVLSIGPDERRRPPLAPLATRPTSRTKAAESLSALLRPLTEPSGDLEGIAKSTSFAASS